MKQTMGRKGEFSMMSGRRWVRYLRVRPCSESLAPSSSHIGLAKLVVSMSLELMERGPARHH